MKTYKVKTICPLFPGFYNTILKGDEQSEINYIENELGKKLKEYKFNYSEYCKKMSEEYTESVHELINDCLNTEVNGLTFNFEKLVSPKYYNYSNDKAYINIDITENSLQVLTSYLKDNLKAFKSYLKDNYKSYDGFISFHSYNSSEWIELLNNANFENKDTAYKLSSALQFVLINEEIDIYKIYNNINDIPYLCCINEELNK